MKQTNERNKKILYMLKLLNFLYATIVKLVEYIGLVYENISRLFTDYNYHEMLSVLITL